MDMVGFGLSAKPDRRYTMAVQADVVAAVAAHFGIDHCALLTHDMGDTVGGELLARSAEGTWPVEVTRRIVTNGSIYIEMAQLTAGQQLLLSMPDTVAPQGPGPEVVAASLVATLAPAHADVDMGAHAELVCHRGGDAVLARTIRYIEERRVRAALHRRDRDAPVAAARGLGPRGPDSGGGDGGPPRRRPSRCGPHVDRRRRSLPGYRGAGCLSRRGGGRPRLTRLRHPAGVSTVRLNHSRPPPEGAP